MLQEKYTVEQLVELIKKENSEEKEQAKRASREKSQVGGNDEKSLNEKFEGDTKNSKAMKKNEEIEQIV